MSMSKEQFETFSEEMKRNKEDGGDYLGTNCIQIGGDDGVILNVSLYDKPQMKDKENLPQNRTKSFGEKLIISLGLLGVLVLGLFPPMYVGWSLHPTSEGLPVKRQFLFANRRISEAVGNAIDWSELWLQWIVVIVATSLLLFLWRNFKNDEEMSIK